MEQAESRLDQSASIIALEGKRKRNLHSVRLEQIPELRCNAYHLSLCPEWPK
jgi:hypothetical protein